MPIAMRALAGLGLLVLLTPAGCGGGNSSFGPPPPPPPAPAEFLYATSYAGVLTFSVDSGTGALTLVPRGTSASENFGIAATPSASFLYASDNAAGGIDGFSIAKTGALSAVSGSPFLLPNDPPNSYPGGVDSLAMHPSGKFLYTPDAPANELVGYAVDASTGALTPVPGSPVPVGVSPTQVVVVPSGTFVYTSNSGDNTISGFTINPSTGAPTQIEGSPFWVPGELPDGLVVHPSGKFLYVVVPYVGGIGLESGVAEFTIDQTSGALTAMQGSPVTFGEVFPGPYSMAQDPSGKYIYVPGSSDGKIYEFSIDASSGNLTPLAHSPFDESVALDASSLTVDPSGRFLYFSAATSTVVSILNIDPSTGELSWATPSYVQASSIPRGFTVVSVPQQ